MTTNQKIKLKKTWWTKSGKKKKKIRQFFFSSIDFFVRFFSFFFGRTSDYFLVAKTSFIITQTKPKSAQKRLRLIFLAIIKKIKETTRDKNVNGSIKCIRNEDERKKKKSKMKGNCKNKSVNSFFFLVLIGEKKKPRKLNRRGKKGTSEIFEILFLGFLLFIFFFSFKNTKTKKVSKIIYAHKR